MQRSPELEDLVRAWFEAATRGDASLVDMLVSPAEGTRLIGSDPGERFSGGTAVAEFLRREVEGAGGQARFAPTETEAFSEGTVGWATASLTITMPDGRHVSHGGAPSFTARTESGGSSRRTPRLASRTKRSAGCTPTDWRRPPARRPLRCNGGSSARFPRPAWLTPTPQRRAPAAPRAAEAVPVAPSRRAGRRRGARAQHLRQEQRRATGMRGRVPDRRRSASPFRLELWVMTEQGR